MMSKPRTIGFLPDLQMPLRDALRGVATLADATEDALEPAAQLLPEPLRSKFQHALASLELAGKRLVHAPIETHQIDAASRFLTAAETDKRAIETCAIVFVYAWEHLNETSIDHPHMISETIVADCLSHSSKISDLTGADFAAAVLGDIRKSSAIGLMPGLAQGITGADKIEVDHALLSIAVWLLSRRADSLTEEEKLLDLSMTLIRALQNDPRQAFAEGENLPRFLADTSAHL